MTAGCRHHLDLKGAFSHAKYGQDIIGWNQKKGSVRALAGSGWRPRQPHLGSWTRCAALATEIESDENRHCNQTESKSPYASGSGRSVAWLARVVRVHEVVSSNLTAPTNLSFLRFYSWHCYFSRVSQPISQSLILKLPGIIERLQPVALFPRTQPLEVELGSGDGSFLVNYAKLHPEQNFLGIERLLGRLRKLDRKSQRAGLTNLRCLRIESAYLVEYLLPPGSVTAIHIYFPDPWPKRKHRKNRLVNQRFAEIAHQALAPRGVVYLRTDDADYFAQMTEVFGANASFQLVETPRELAEVVTDFERGFLARGVKTLRAAYAKRD